MKRKIIIFSMLAVFTLGSCEKMLDVAPKSEITGGSYWRTENDVKGYLTGIYNKYRSLSNTTLYGEDRSDMYVAGFIGGYMTYAWANRLTPTNGFDWFDFYSLVHHCNMVLKYAPWINYNVAANKDSNLAEAHFIRASIYFTMLQMWGDVPIVTQPSESIDVAKPSRSSKADVMALILNDIKKAVELFPTDAIADKNRASKIAAYCLKAEALAWKYKVLESNDAQDITDALDAISAVEQSGVALVQGDYASIFASGNKKNSEIIFSIYFQKDESPNMYATNLSTRRDAVENAVNREDIAYTSGANALHTYAPSPKMKAALDKYPNDKRKAVGYIEAIDKATNNIILTAQNKFRGHQYDDDRYFDDDIIIYRLADMVLLKAELLADQGGASVQLAITELNRIRERAGIGAYAGNTDQRSVQLEILDERYRELCYERKRWPDLMRAHHAGIIDIYDVIPNLNGQTTPLYLPIKPSMITLNTNLLQTEGYTD